MTRERCERVVQSSCLSPRKKKSFFALCAHTKLHRVEMWELIARFTQPTRKLTCELTTLIVVLFPTSISYPSVGAWLNLMTMSWSSFCSSTRLIELSGKVNFNIIFFFIGTAIVVWYDDSPMKLPRPDPVKLPALETMTHELPSRLRFNCLCLGINWPNLRMLNGGSFVRMNLILLFSNGQMEGVLKVWLDALR